VRPYPVIPCRHGLLGGTSDVVSCRPPATVAVLLLLGLLAGVTAAFALPRSLALVVPTPRLTRLEKATNAANAFVFTSQVGDMHPDWKRLPLVPRWPNSAVWDLIFCYLDGQPNGVFVRL